MLWIARESLKAPLPKDWKPCRADNGDVYYYNFATYARYVHSPHLLFHTAFTVFFNFVYLFFPTHSIHVISFSFFNSPFRSVRGTTLVTSTIER